MRQSQLWIILIGMAFLAGWGSGSNLSYRDVDEILNVVKLSDCEIIHDNGSISFVRSETCDKARLTGAQGFYRFGQSDFHKGKYEEAILNYSKAIYLEPNVADDIYLKRGSIYAILGRYEESIPDYLAYIEIKPDDVRAYQILALSYIELGRNEEAIADYDRAIEIGPADARSYYNRGIAYKNLGLYEEVIADHSKAIELKSDFSNAYNNRALSYHGLGLYEEAIADYDKAIALEADKGHYWRNRSRAKRALGDRDGAIRDCDHAKSFYLVPINCY